MVDIKVGRSTVVFEVEGLDKLWSFRGRLEIPLTHVKAVYADQNPAMGWLDGFKVFGTAIPNIFRAGTFYQEGNLIFWDVHNAQKTIVIQLENEHFAKLIIEVADPNAAVNLITNAIYINRP